MALTEAEEAKLRTLINAFDGGQQIDDLPLATSTIQDKEIEVFDKKTGASGRMGIRDAVNMANRPYFARVWNKANSTTKAESWEGSLEFGRSIPEVLGLGRWLVKNDHSRTKLDPTNSYRLVTGSPAKLDGSMGHFNFSWATDFYIAIWYEGTYEKKALSLYPLPGKYNYHVPIASNPVWGNACMERSTGRLCSYVNDDPDYRGGDNNADWDGTYRSLLGMPVTSLTVSAAQTAARKNGTGWYGGLTRMDWVMALLFEIIFGDTDVQKAYNPERDSDGLYQGGLGPGVTEWTSDGWNTYNGYRPFIPTSAGLELGDACGVINYDVKGADGSVVYTAKISSFFGYLGFNKGLWSLIEDAVGKVNADTTITHMMAPSLYGDWTLSTGAGMVEKSVSPPYSGGWIKRVSYENFELWPTEVGGGPGTWNPDWFWNTSGLTSGFRLVLRGCNANNGGNSGPYDVNVNNGVTNSNVNIGSPLNF